MDEEEAALFMMTLAALNAAEQGGSAEAGLIESAEPMTATCEVEYADGHKA